MNRVWSYVPSDNEAALRCFASAGFVREGLLRECAVRAGEFVDCHTMSLLAREWGKAREAGRVAPPSEPACREDPVVRTLPSDTFPPARIQGSTRAPRADRGDRGRRRTKEPG